MGEPAAVSLGRGKDRPTAVPQFTEDTTCFIFKGLLRILPPSPRENGFVRSAEPFAKESPPSSRPKAGALQRLPWPWTERGHCPWTQSLLLTARLQNPD